MGTGVIQRGEQRKSVVSEVEDATKGSLLQQSMAVAPREINKGLSVLRRRCAVVLVVR